MDKTNALTQWLRLLRWRNLLIILLTQWAVWQLVLVPFHQEGRMLLQPLYFWMLCLSTVFIAAAGYAINDYFDVRIDAINKPHELVLGQYIPRKLAIISHLTLNAIGVFLAFWVAWKGGHPEWVLLQILCVVLLWFYSSSLKQRFMWGNLTVSLLTALTIFALWLYEPGIHAFTFRPAFLPARGRPIPNPVYVLGIYAAFAFLLTWMREIVKDMEDFEGDDAEGCRTMPILWGLKKSGVFVQVLGVAALLPLALAAFKMLQKNLESLLGWYVLLLVLLPLFIWTITLNQKATTRHYHRYSRYLKYIMLAGIGSLFVYRFYYG